MMARPDIAAIKERAALATRGPWRFRTEEGYDDASHWWTAWVEAEDGKEIIGYTDDPWDNGEFIAAAPEDIDALLAYVAELERRCAFLLDFIGQVEGNAAVGVQFPAASLGTCKDIHRMAGVIARSVLEQPAHPESEQR